VTGRADKEPSLDSPAPRVLITSDGQDPHGTLQSLLRREGFDASPAGPGPDGLRALRAEPFDAVVIDRRGPAGGPDLLREVRGISATVPVVLLAPAGAVAAEAVRVGATAVLTRPFRSEDVVAAVRQAVAGRAPADCELGLREVMGASQAVGRIATGVARVAPTDFTVLLQGETGTGKEVVAREIHRRSRRASGPFVPVDCGAIPQALIESELFGHEKGAFTGADRPAIGSFAAATGGTIFLDEIGNLPLVMQAKLLRVLQEKQVRRVGAPVPTEVDVRVVAATNVDLAGLAKAGRFRPDLYHRLNEFKVPLPPLRERPEDVPHLTGRFLAQACAELNKRLGGVSPAALERLMGHGWPGNVRELRNVVRRAALLADTVVEPEHLDLGEAEPPAAADAPVPALDGRSSLKELIRDRMAATERGILLQALRQTGGNKAQAARLLRVDYKTIRTKAKEHGICTLPGDDDERE
jgi:two-component system nitrogen regulation response regulator GlnG